MFDEDVSDIMDSGLSDMFDSERIMIGDAEQSITAVSDRTPMNILSAQLDNPEVVNQEDEMYFRFDNNHPEEPPVSAEEPIEVPMANQTAADPVTAEEPAILGQLAAVSEQAPAEQTDPKAAKKAKNAEKQKNDNDKNQKKKNAFQVLAKKRARTNSFDTDELVGSNNNYLVTYNYFF